MNAWKDCFEFGNVSTNDAEEMENLCLFSHEIQLIFEKQAMWTTSYTDWLFYSYILKKITHISRTSPDNWTNGLIIKIKHCGTYKSITAS